MMKKGAFKLIQQHLKEDPKLAPLLDRIRIEVPEISPQPDVYLALLRAIVYQQLSDKAAGTIYQRFLDAFPEKYPQADLLLALDAERLRSLGLSRQKGQYVQNVARFFEERSIQSQDMTESSDERIIELFTQIKGVGKWTVQMLLMFTLGRPDVFPEDDLTIQQALTELYRVQEKGQKKKEALRKIAEKWRPYRSYASFYLWRWKDE